MYCSNYTVLSFSLSLSLSLHVLFELGFYVSLELKYGNPCVLAAVLNRHYTYTRTEPSSLDSAKKTGDSSLDRTFKPRLSISIYHRLSNHHLCRPIDSGMEQHRELGFSRAKVLERLLLKSS
ncbi:uncharacterized protein LOC131332444 [Rhododendron vialii]|uniref:uncharacterized protein LOC131332444 n=1 Tax=Rhododendron vialii TaxID=182163 RepID=UPI00265DEB00|nr:uncharacterized protein LOC131332444 [Rhododendron vialii]